MTNDIFTGKELQNVVEFVTPDGINQDVDFTVEILQPDKPYRTNGKICHGETDSDKADPLPVRIYVPKNIQLPITVGVYKFKIDNKKELELYTLAHELYHVWQVKCDFYTFLLGRRLNLIDDASEQEADRYAISKLREWREASK